MAQVRFVCSDCHTPLDAEVRQYDEDGEMYWNATYSCDECGMSTDCEGGEGLPNSDLRHRLILAEGRFRLVVEDADLTELAFSEVIRQVFGLRPTGVNLLVESVPGVAFHGTEAECEVLERALSRDGYAIRIERA